MVRSSFLKIFPPPQYLLMPATGLDISDRSVKFCDLKAGVVPSFKRYGEQTLPVGAIDSGRLKDKGLLIKALTELRQEYNLSHVNFALPEEQAYIIKLVLPSMPRKNLRQSIELQLEEHIPLNIDDITFDYEIIETPERGGKYQLAVSVFPRQLVADYTEVLSQAGFVPLGCEIEAQAVARSVIKFDFNPTKSSPKETILVIDFGRTRAGLFVVSDGVVMATATVNQIGGEVITTAIQKSLGLDFARAEELKLAKGLLRVRGDNRILFAIAPIVSALRDEVVKLQIYWETRHLGGRAEKIDRIIICGGQSTLPGLVEYVRSSLKLPVSIGDVWTNLLDASRIIPPLPLNEALKYSTAIGLALRNFIHD